MTRDDPPSISRRTAVKTVAAGLGGFPSVAAGSGAEHPPVDDLLLTTQDVPDSYQGESIDPEEAPFYRELWSRTSTASMEIAAQSFIERVDGKPVAGVGNFALRYTDSRPRRRTVKRALAASLEGFERELAGALPSHTMTRMTGDFLEWRVTIPSPDWELDAAYRDVTHLQIRDRTILGVSAFGPLTDESDPLRQAHRCSALTYRRQREVSR